MLGLPTRLLPVRGTRLLGWLLLGLLGTVAVALWGTLLAIAALRA